MTIRGLCGEMTTKKQDIFDKFIDHQMNIVEQIYKGMQWHPYMFFDLFSGPGYICDENYEGPTSSVKVKNFVEFREFDFKIVAAEKDDGRREMLSTILDGDNVTILKDARQCLPARMNSHSYGMVYFDPPMDKAGFELVRLLAPKFSEVTPKCDILMYLSATYFARFNNADHVNFYDQIIAIMNDTNKEYWFVCEVGGRNRYVFILGTNYGNWANYKGIGMHSTKTHSGWNTLKQLGYEYVKPKFETYNLTQGGF